MPKITKGKVATEKDFEKMEAEQAEAAKATEKDMEALMKKKKSAKAELKKLGLSEDTISVLAR